MKFYTGFLGLIIFLLIALGWNGCTKVEEKIVPVQNNIAPPDTAVEWVVINAYINKTYIALLGRKPTNAEIFRDSTLLDMGDFTQNAREKFVKSVMAEPQYLQRRYETALVDLLNNLDTMQIQMYIGFYKTALDLQPNQGAKDEIQRELDKILALQNIPNDLPKGLTQVELHRRCIFNPFYDEINMGSLNFVLSVFEHFVQRKPTEAEQTAAVKMVDDEYANLFGQEAAGKSKFVDIFFNSGDYYEGAIRQFYRRFLLREPNSSELTQFSNEYRAHKDYDAMIVKFLTLNEYAGIQ